jgi:hypothetical protein
MLQRRAFHQWEAFRFLLTVASSSILVDSECDRSASFKPWNIQRSYMASHLTRSLKIRTHGHLDEGYDHDRGNGHSEHNGSLGHSW